MQKKIINKNICYNLQFNLLIQQNTHTRTHKYMNMDIKQYCSI